MCVSPIRIKKDIQNGSPLHLVKKDHNCFGEDVRNLLRPYHFSDMLVPCGKCIECMRDRSNDIAIRSYLAAQKFGNMAFVTLTYAPMNLPLAARLVLVDKEDGSVVKDSKYKFVSESSSKIEELRKRFVDLKNCKSSIHVPIDISNQFDVDCYSSDYYCYAEVIPSLDRRDIKLWLKRVRISYKRKFGHSLPEFKYLCVGEYGPKTGRPHYHLNIFGLNESQVNFIVADWQVHYGFADIKMVKPINSNGTSGFLAAARYIGKYISKGVFECDAVKNGDCEKPRCCTSVGLFELSEGLIKYYRCEDVFGRYDINRLCCDGTTGVFSLPDLEKLSEEVRKRQKYSIGGFDYKLPRSFIRKLWYEKDEFTGQYKASTVRLVLQSFVQTDISTDFVKSFLRVAPDAQRESVVEALGDFCKVQENSKLLSVKTAEEAYLNFLNKSIF